MTAQRRQSIDWWVDLVLCCLTLLLLTACATTVPTVEEGWVPLAEWQYRTTHTDPVGTFLSKTFNGSPRQVVRTYCYHSRRSTSCMSY